ncbi:class I SAM-dependent methyltransferase [Kitasatospora sp. LaBMicrA B282]|uniref:class I SAM-dependent methyltransferase n=1 Tax=Kitasatospora sp. LaBMicrA B282 TaxID=3420949 RepID=UPI003D107297
MTDRRSPDPGCATPLTPERCAPLTPEQALHLLDALTWAPAAGPDRWERAADHVAARVGDLLRPAPAHCRAAAERMLPALDRTSLYRAKYDLMLLLHPDDWFTFMNMGHQPAAAGAVAQPAAPGPQPGGADQGRYAARLYDLVVGGAEAPADGAAADGAAAGGALAGAVVLDVGSGRGGGTERLTRVHGARSATGLDLSPASVAFCRRVHRGLGLGFEQGRAEDLPFAAGSFDAVVSVESAHCFADPDAFFAEARRVLRPGGRLLFADEWPADQVDRLAARVTAAGLHLVVQEDITDGVLRALDLLPAQVARLLAALPADAGRQAYTRFFGDRVGRDSAGLYRSGRFRYLRLAAVRGK